jgi:hypothetical protein
MAFPTNANQVQAFAGAMYGIQIGSVTLAQVNNDILAAGSLTSALNSYYSASFGSSTTAAVAATVAANLGLTGDALSEGTNYVTARLNAVASNARGAVIADILNLFAGLASDATYGTAATAWNVKVAAAAAYTATADVAIGTVVSTTAFTLTTGVNKFTGGAGDDSFDASLISGAQTWQASDALVGGAGTDTITATLISSVTPLSMAGIEVVNATVTTAATLNLVNATGVTNLNSVNSTAATTFSGITTAVTPSISDSASDHVLTYTGVSGSADAETARRN